MAIAKDKLTEAQKQEVERLRQFATRNRYELKMNSTRWRAALDAILALPGYSLSYQCRCLTDPKDATSDWKTDFPQGLPLYNAIEWLEVQWSQPSGSGKDIRLAFQRDFPAQLRDLEAVLRTAGVPFQTQERGVRILGYVKN